VATEKDIIRLIYNVAVCGVKHDLEDDAEAICRTMIDKFPTHSAFRHGLLCALEKKEQWDEAQSTVSALLEEGQFPPDMLYSVRIRCHLFADNLEDAKATISAWREQGVDEKYKSIIAMYDESIAQLGKIDAAANG